MVSVEKQVQATREGGAVQRCHVIRHHRAYDVAQHTFGAVNLLLLLHPGPSVRLIKAVQWHDIAERWTGDVPATAKWMCPALREALRLLEEPLMRMFGLHQELDLDDQRWLAAVDILELWLWARENRDEPHPKQIMEACEKYIVARRITGELPEEAWDFYLAMATVPPHRLLPDTFDGLVPA